MRSLEKHIDIDEKRKETYLEKGEKYSRKVATIATKRDYSKPEASLGIAVDSEYQESILKQVEHLKGVSHIVLVGIGGSSLGTEAIYTALAFKTNARLCVLDSIEDSSVAELKHFLETTQSKDDIAIVVISKSGTTTETMTNGVIAMDTCEEHYDEAINGRTVFIGTEDTDFLNIGKEKEVTCITFPESIGGRYSIFTAVGIVPLWLLGIDVESFKEGAGDALSKDYRKQILDHAASLACLAEQGVHTVNFFTFNERLRRLGFWYRQLLAESIGKTMTTEGATFSHQLLPTVATSVDLHSMAQLYLGGYKGMYTHFIYADTECDYHALSDHWLLGHMAILKAKTPRKIKNAIREGVMKAYDDQKLAYRLTSLDKITAYELGLLMGTFMFEVMVLGHLFDVDVFDQPNVEAYKLHTRKLLAS